MTRYTFTGSCEVVVEIGGDHMNFDAAQAIASNLLGSAREVYDCRGGSGRGVQAGRALVRVTTADVKRAVVVAPCTCQVHVEELSAHYVRVRRVAGCAAHPLKQE